MTTLINETDDQLMRSLVKHYRDIGSFIRPSMALSIIQEASKMSMYSPMALKLTEAQLDFEAKEFSMNKSSGSFSKMMIILSTIRRIDQRSNAIKLN